MLMWDIFKLKEQFMESNIFSLLHLCYIKPSEISFFKLILGSKSWITKKMLVWDILKFLFLLNYSPKAWEQAPYNFCALLPHSKYYAKAFLDRYSQKKYAFSCPALMHGTILMRLPPKAQLCHDLPSLA